MDVFEAGYLRLLVCVMGLDKTPDPLCAYIFCKNQDPGVYMYSITVPVIPV